jgi:hypothetical protein
MIEFLSAWTRASFYVAFTLFGLFFVVISVVYFFYGKKIVPPSRHATSWISMRFVAPFFFALGLYVLWITWS